MLGIGERTLYRAMQEWKVQDQIKSALAGANGDVAAAAEALGMTTDSLQKRLKKFGQRTDEE
jgi:transcriptional regulator with GAF, ATPase, and Fis domain